MQRFSPVVYTESLKTTAKYCGIINGTVSFCQVTLVLQVQYQIIDYQCNTDYRVISSLNAGFFVFGTSWEHIRNHRWMPSRGKTQLFGVWSFCISPMKIQNAKQGPPSLIHNTGYVTCVTANMRWFGQAALITSNFSILLSPSLVATLDFFHSSKSSSPSHDPGRLALPSHLPQCFPMSPVADLIVSWLSITSPDNVPIQTCFHPHVGYPQHSEACPAYEFNKCLLGGEKSFSLFSKYSICHCERTLMVILPKVQL